MSRRTPSPSRTKSAPARPTNADPTERLQKVLAAAGIGSRRECETFIEEGRVEVDQEVVVKLGSKVDPARQQIRVDGEPLNKPQLQYFALNKPTGVISTNRDPAGRQRVTDLVPKSAGRLFNVGRLDMSSEGLILLTNDGELANRLTHPRYGVTKTYLVEVAGHPKREVLSKLRDGVYLAEGIARVVGVRIKNRRKNSTILEMILSEGRNREIRRVLARVGHKVLRLVRVAIGPVRLGDMPPGAHRKLTRDEVRALRSVATAGGSRAGDSPPRKRTRRTKATTRPVTSPSGKGTSRQGTSNKGASRPGTRKKTVTPAAQKRRRRLAKG